MRYQATLLVCVVLAFGVILAAQTEDIDEDIQFHSKELDRLRGEIDDFQKRIKQASIQEKSTRQNLGELDQEISLVRNLLYRLKKEEEAKRRAFVQTESDLAEKQRDYTHLQLRYARRVVDVYKKGLLSDLEILFDSESWRQAVYRTKYLRVISDYDRTLAQRLQLTLQEIFEKRTSLERELKDMERIDRERTVRKQWLEKRRRMRNSELIRLKRNRQEFSEAIQEREEATKELEAIMARLEREKAARLAELERRRREEQLLASASFPALKGKLPWPVDGRIISRFGSHRNPTLKTVIENPGIDIGGTAGKEVRAVHDGIVTTVTYIRGYGNTIIIDHGDGFYTVYTHVIDVEVQENDYVGAYDVIAHVGDSGSLDGAKLHFEIWGNRTKLNPEIWLRKS